ncbi:MAG: serine hydrolase domain-containing protein [Acidimicrobiales bacterium]
MAWLAVAWRRGEHHRPAAGGDRHELLRRLHPPTGEPATRPLARHCSRVLTPVAGAGRLRDLQRAHWPHRQARPGGAASGRRRQRRHRHGVGRPLELVATWPADHAAAAVIDAEGLSDHTGQTDKPFALASVTKLLTALAVLVAVEEGTVSPDDPAGPPGATVRHLLAHASGLAPDDRGSVLAGPGTRRMYSNAGFEVLADVVAARAGLPFTQYLTEAVLQPLRMGATTLAGSPAWGASSTVDDLARFAQELLRPTLVDSATMAEATSVAFPGLVGVLPGYGRQDPNDWGLGFELRDAKHPHWTGASNSPSTFGHFGRAGTFLWVDPDAALACVVLTDRTFGQWAIDAWPPFNYAVVAEFSRQ